MDLLPVLLFAYLALFSSISFVDGEQNIRVAGQWKVSYKNPESGLLINTGDVRKISVAIYDIDISGDIDFYFCIHTEHHRVAIADKAVRKQDLTLQEPDSLRQWQGKVDLQGHRFGYTNLFVGAYAVENDSLLERNPVELDVSVVRADGIDDRIFRYVAAALILLMFINLGTVLDLERLKNIIFRPIGPLLAVCSRYLVMPAIGLGLGALCLHYSIELRLALFFTALAPSGGLANICTIFLKGNINLSVAATTVNSLLALAMFPLWMLIVAGIFSEQDSITIPYVDLAVGSIAVVIAIGLGITLRSSIPKTTTFIFKFLKPLSVILSFCLIGATVGFNSFIFRELNLMIIVATFFLPVCGYLIAYFASRLLCRSSTDALTIAVETSVLNMTVPILLLQYSFPQPMADMTIVVPIMAALLSQCLFCIFYLIRRLLGWNKKYDEDAFDEKLFLVMD